MNSRERMARAVNFKSPDRIPLKPDVQKGAWTKLGKPLEEYLNSLPLDRTPFRCDTDSVRKASRWTDAWGCDWENARDGEYGTCIGHPLTNWESMETYRFPDLRSPVTKGKAPAPDKAVSAPAYYTTASGSGEYGVLWYRMQFLRGFENVMMDLAESPERLCRLRDGVLETRIGQLDEILKSDVDAIHFGDCWGMQSSLMIQPKDWQRFFQPAYKKLFDRVHAAGKRVIFQSDGYTMDIIDDLIALGADVLRISVGMMDMKELGRKIRGKACLWADPCRQHILPNGSPEQVRNHIRQIVETFRTPTGGLIGGLYIYEDVPLENVRAALDTYLE